MDKVGEQLPAIATTVAGLILVFLGMIATAWDSYGAVDQDSVRIKYRIRMWLTFAAFVFSLLSCGFGLYGIYRQHIPPWPDCTGLSCLILSVILMVVVAFLAVKEI